MTVVKPCALDFALMIHASQELECQAHLYLAALKVQIKIVLEERGFQEVCLESLVQPASSGAVAAGCTIVVLARLPFDKLNDPVLRMHLPLAVTYAGTLAVQEARINQFTVKLSFGQPLSSNPADLADQLVQFLSEQYMAHLRQVRSPSVRAILPNPRRQYLAGM